MRSHFYFIALAIFTSSCIGFKPIEFQGIESMQMIEQIDTITRVELRVKIKNPNNYRLVIKKIDLDASLNKKQIGRISHVERLIIPKKSEDSYPIRLDANMAQMQKIFPSLLFSGAALVNVKGKVKGRALLIPKSIDIEINQKVSKKDLGL